MTSLDRENFREDGEVEEDVIPKVPIIIGYVFAAIQAVNLTSWLQCKGVKASM